jgi:hypothetical protein
MNRREVTMEAFLASPRPRPPSTRTAIASWQPVSYVLPLFQALKQSIAADVVSERKSMRLLAVLHAGIYSECNECISIW